jgi:hypothetical protein
MASAAPQSAPLVCQVTFDGAAGAGSSVAAQTAGKHHQPSRARLCLRRTKHARVRCAKLRHVTPPAIAALKRRFSTSGQVKLHVPLSKVGRLLLLAVAKPTASTTIITHIPTSTQPCGSRSL